MNEDGDGSTSLGSTQRLVPIQRRYTRCNAIRPWCPHVHNLDLTSSIAIFLLHHYEPRRTAQKSYYHIRNVQHPMSVVNPSRFYDAIRSRLISPSYTNSIDASVSIPLTKQQVLCVLTNAADKSLKITRGLASGRITWSRLSSGKRKEIVYLLYWKRREAVRLNKQTSRMCNKAHLVKWSFSRSAKTNNVLLWLLQNEDARGCRVFMLQDDLIEQVEAEARKNQMVVRACLCYLSSWQKASQSIACLCDIVHRSRKSVEKHKVRPHDDRHRTKNSRLLVVPKMIISCQLVLLSNCKPNFIPLSAAT